MEANPMAKMRILLACVLILQSCAASKRPMEPCPIEDFTLSRIEHIVEQAEKPFVVRHVRGQLISEGGDWPDDWPILFEIRGTWAGAKTIRAYADGKGNFEIPAVAEGRYCFKATVEGWRSVIGIIKVDRHANPKRSIRIVMLMGV
jgi:hypothetical protein